MQRLMSIGRKAITRSRSRARTSINRLSLRSPLSSSTRRSPNNYPGYPRGRLSVVKHRKFARQVGAYSAIVIKSSTDFDNMIFPTGSIFIFGSWICEADGEGNLLGCLIEARKAREEITLSMGSVEDLAERFSGLTVFESTQAPTTTSLDLVSRSDSSSGSNSGSFGDKPSSFPIGF
jgi:hypothetical protein